MNTYRVSVWTGPGETSAMEEAAGKLRAAGAAKVEVGTERLDFKVCVDSVGVQASIDAFYAALDIVKTAFGETTGLRPVVMFKVIT